MNRGSVIHPKVKVVTQGYQQDAIVVKRRTGGADAEGNPLDTLTVLSGVTQGHWHSLEPKRSGRQAVEEAGQGATRAEALLVLGPTANVRVGDLVTITSTGRNYEIETVDKQRLKVRCWLKSTI